MGLTNERVPEVPVQLLACALGFSQADPTGQVES